MLFFVDCKFNCHKRCAYKVPNDCLGETLGGNESVRETVLTYLTHLEYLHCCVSASKPVIITCALCLSWPLFLCRIADMLSPSTDAEVPMDYSNDYIDHDKSSLMDDSDEACSIPGSFSPDSGQDGASGDQRFVRQVLIRLKSFAIKTHKDVKDIF